MKKYNENTKCPKCGEVETEDLYYQFKIGRECKNCSYFWFEKPLDYKEESTKHQCKNCVFWRKINDQDIIIDQSDPYFGNYGFCIFNTVIILKLSGFWFFRKIWKFVSLSYDEVPKYKACVKFNFGCDNFINEQIQKKVK